MILPTLRYKINDAIKSIDIDIENQYQYQYFLLHLRLSSDITYIGLKLFSTSIDSVFLSRSIQ